MTATLRDDDQSVSNVDTSELEASQAGSLGADSRQAERDALASAAAGTDAIDEARFEELAALPVFLSALDESEEVVIGDDDRVRIEPTAAFPWRSICSLQILAGDGTSWIGTGWFIGHRTLVTAGHCVYQRNNGGWPRSITVIPGRDGNERPFGSARATRFYSTRGWVESTHRTHDYGAIVLPEDSPLGGQLGYFGFANYGTAKLRRTLVHLSGYPGDKGGATQWWHSRRLDTVHPRVLDYAIDTAGGQSGAPVWRVEGDQTYAVGIHTNGHQSGNSATRIESSVYANLQRWKSFGQ